MKNDRVLALLGLANKAKGVASGEFACECAIKDGKAHVVIVGCDASDNTKKKFRNSCEYYRVPYYEYGTKEELGRHIGKEMRASVAVTNAGLAGSLIKLLDSSNLGGSIDG